MVAYVSVIIYVHFVMTEIYACQIIGMYVFYKKFGHALTLQNSLICDKQNTIDPSIIAFFCD